VKFTRIPKVEALIAAGVPTEVIPTYCALSDYSANKTGLCFPKMQTLAQTLNRSLRTVQRHLHLLKDLGLIEFVERRRYKGRFSSYLYRVLHIAKTTGHGQRVGSRSLYKERTKVPTELPNEASNAYTDIKPREQWRREKITQRIQEEQDRKRGYEWLFGE
jgi:DNA-binding transcriptional ArsR family regulator